MAKKDKLEALEANQDQEMSLEEARAFRAALHKPVAQKLSEPQKREAFRTFWAKAKRSYNKDKDLESILWLHLKSTKMDEPEQFEAGLEHFGLKKAKN